MKNKTWKDIDHCICGSFDHKRHPTETPENQKPQHTPTPWHTKPYQSDLRMMATIGGSDGIQVAYTTPENAAFIVRAVNAHKELLMVLKDALCELDPDCNYDGSNAAAMPNDDRKKTILSLYKAIAKAEGK